MPGSLLVLIPTELESARVRGALAKLPARATVELCGFGPIVAAARSMQAIARHRPRSVLLLGIAGALHARLELGGAYEFSSVVSYGIGAGSGSAYRSANQLGWKQWPDAAAAEIDQQLELQATPTAHEQLLTCCAASASPLDVELRREAFPLAAAEDMEGFAVAAACRLTQTPLRIIRGISNLAGDRQHKHWRIDDALQAAAELAIASYTAS